MKKRISTSFLILTFIFSIIALKATGEHSNNMVLEEDVVNTNSNLVVQSDNINLKNDESSMHILESKYSSFESSNIVEYDSAVIENKNVEQVAVENTIPEEVESALNLNEEVSIPREIVENEKTEEVIPETIETIENFESTEEVIPETIENFESMEVVQEEIVNTSTLTEEQIMEFEKYVSIDENNNFVIDDNAVNELDSQNFELLQNTIDDTNENFENEFYTVSEDNSLVYEISDQELGIESKTRGYGWNGVQFYWWGFKIFLSRDVAKRVLDFGIYNGAWYLTTVLKISNPVSFVITNAVYASAWLVTKLNSGIWIIYTYGLGITGVGRL
jgi:hypothetical protein